MVRYVLIVGAFLGLSQYLHAERIQVARCETGYGHDTTTADNTSRELYVTGFTGATIEQNFPDPAYFKCSFGASYLNVQIANKFVGRSCSFSQTSAAPVRVCKSFNAHDCVLYCDLRDVPVVPEKPIGPGEK